MARIENRFSKPFVASPAGVEAARSILHQLGADDARFVLVDRVTDEKIEFSDEVFAVIRLILSDMAQNRPIMWIPLSQELTTFQAAELLNVSRPYVIKLLAKKNIAHRMVGTHRRILLSDLLAFKEKSRLESEAALQELADISQEMGLE